MGRTNLGASQLTREIVPAETVLPAGDSITSDPIALGISEVQAMDWNFEGLGGPIDMQISIEQSNAQASAEFVLWSNPTTVGTATTNTVLITTGQDGTNISLAPSVYARFVIFNNGAEDITIHRFTLFMS